MWQRRKNLSSELINDFGANLRREVFRGAVAQEANIAWKVGIPCRVEGSTKG